MKETRKWKKLMLAGVLGGLVAVPLSNAMADDVIAGKTIGEWSAEFWDWAYENGFPDSGAFAVNSYDDETGELLEGVDCSLGQEGPVWFLSGMGADDCCDPEPGELPADRTCIDPIPHGKRLFFPLINVSMYNPDSWCGEDEFCTVEEKREIADNVLNDFEPGPLVVPEDDLTGTRACFLSAYVDGRPVIYDGTLIVRTQSPTFPIGDDPEAIADGYYVMLPMLPKGEHTIDFTGAICQFEGDTVPENIIFGSKIRYELTIGGKKYHHDDDDDDDDDHED